MTLLFVIYEFLVKFDVLERILYRSGHFEFTKTFDEIGLLTNLFIIKQQIQLKVTKT